MTVTLWEHPLSPCAQKNKIALREKQVAFEALTPQAMGTGAAAGDFVAASPRAEVPALVDGDLRIFDSTIIQEYIEDRWPSPALLPSTPAARAKVRMIEEVMDTHYEAITWGMMEVRVFGRAPGAAGEALLARAAQQLAGLNAWLERQIGRSHWFNDDPEGSGDAFGWGDIAVIPFVNGAAGFGVPPAPGSALAAWLARANARPSVAATAEEASIAAVEVAKVVPGAIASGQFRREYRDHRLEWMIRSGGLDVVREGLAADNIRFSAELA